MKLLRSLVIVAGVALALGAVAGRADATDFGAPCIGCNNNGGPGPRLGQRPRPNAGPGPQQTTLFGQFQGFGLLARPKLPAFQAAPWYNYWPYDGHFLTPAPVTGAFYGPPMTGNFPVNPYFPGGQAPSYGPAFGYPSLPPGIPQPYPPAPPQPLPQPMPLPGR